MMKSIDPYDHIKGDSFWDDGYELKWFELLTYRNIRFVLYGVGQWTGHTIDWLGCNFMHGRLPGSPVFNTAQEAVAWLRFQVKHKAYKKGMTLPGHHAGEYMCGKGCDDRMVQRKDLPDLK